MKKNKLTKTLLGIIFISCALPALAQGPIQWNNIRFRLGTSGGGSYPKEANYDVKHLSSGNVIGVGSAHPASSVVFYNDLAVRKYRSTDGVVIGEYYLDAYGADQEDKAIKVVVKEPYIYVLATCKFGTPSFDNDIVLFKLDTSLSLQWSRIFNGAGNVNDEAVDMGSDAAGNIYMVGNTSRAATGNDLVLLKYKPDGTNLFTKYYTSSGNFSDSAKAMAVESNGVCNVTGTYGSSVNGQRLVVLKTWGNGVPLWTKFHDVVSSTANADEGKAISFDPATSDVYVTGRGQNTAGNYDWVAVKFDGADGTKLWNKKYMSSGTPDDEGTGISFTALGELFTCGNMATTVSSVSSPNVLLKKLNPSDGSTIFTRTYNYFNGPVGPAQDYSRSMISTPAGNIYIVGNMEFPTQTYTASYQLVLAYNPAGTLLWSHTESSLSSSGFQEYVALCAAFSNTHSSLYVGGFKNITMTFVGYATMMKFGPVTIAGPEKESRDMEDELTLNVYPNPAADYFIVQGDEDTKAEVDIYDLNGRCVLKAECTESENRIDISMLESGVYIVRYVNSNRSKTFRLIKQ